MRAHPVDVDAPLLDQNACFFQAVEQFAIQNLTAKLAIERFTVTALPGTARLDISLGWTVGRPNLPDVSV
jgi:hypothetical protein